MQETRKLTISEARQFLTTHQGLDPPRQLENDADIVAFIEKVGCIQYDPLNRVGRNADLVLQSRCKNYSEKVLFDLLYNKRALIDAWDKNMAIMSVKDWPYFERSRQYYKNRYQDRKKEFAPVRQEIKQKLAENGHLNSQHIDHNHKVNWGWAPTQISRATLESMYHCGELIIHHKLGTRKYYDFAHRHLPESLLNTPDPNETEKDYFAWRVNRRIGAIGLLWNRSGDAWLGIRDFKKEQRTKAISRLLKKRKIAEVHIEGIDDVFYVRQQDIRSFDLSTEYHCASIIAPLDNLIWDRNLVSRLFAFDYKWEVYTPAEKRKYGYYVLPVLYADKFIARFEPVLDRRNNELCIVNWWWEDKIKIDTDMSQALIACFSDFMRFTSADKISFKGGVRKNKLQWFYECSNRSVNAYRKIHKPQDEK